MRLEGRGLGRSPSCPHLIEEGFAGERVVLVAQEGLLNLALPLWWSLIAAAEVFRVASIWHPALQAWAAVPLRLRICLEPLQKH